MNDVSLQLGLGADLGLGSAESPILNSYQGLSGSELIGLADLQSGYNPTPPLANQQQAMQYVQAAAQATDPALAQQLLEDAIGLLEPNGSAPSPQPITPQPIVSPQPIISDPPATPITTTPVTTTSADTTGSDPGLTVSGNSVNTGEYTITAGTGDDGSLTITNNQTGQSVEVWGDPHIKVNGQDTADFQNDDLNIQLQDGTVIHIQPTATNSAGKAHIAQVSITKGDQAVTIGGTGPNGFEDGVTTSGVMNGDASFQTSLYNTPTATDITLGADGNLYYNNANGSMGAEITPAVGGGETDLDGAGGGLVGDPTTASTTSDPTTSSVTMQQAMEQLSGLLAQNQDSFYSIMMMQTLDQMMSQSGYAQA
jgi:hypothetical protein